MVELRGGPVLREMRVEHPDLAPVYARECVLEAHRPPAQAFDLRTQKLDTGFERRKIYDTTQPGRNNGGHTFGDELTDAERWAVIEYLKTL